MRIKQISKYVKHLLQSRCSVNALFPKGSGEVIQLLLCKTSGLPSHAGYVQKALGITPILTLEVNLDTYVHELF